MRMLTNCKRNVYNVMSLIMEEKKLILTPKKFKTDSTTIISAPVSTELMKKIENLAKKTTRNRNEIPSF